MLDARNLSKMVELLEHQGDQRLLSSLLSLKSSAIDAFVEKLLVASVEAGNIIVTREILDTGTDPNVWGRGREKNSSLMPCQPGRMG